MSNESCHSPVDSARDRYDRATRNMSLDARQRIENGLLTKTEEQSPLFNAAVAAWWEYLKLTQGAFIPANDGMMHHPV